MTTADVIDQIKSLGPQERAKVLNVLREIESAQKIDQMDDQTFDQAADRVAERHAEVLRKLAQ